MGRSFVSIRQREASQDHTSGSNGRENCEYFLDCFHFLLRRTDPLIFYFCRKFFFLLI